MMVNLTAPGSDYVAVLPEYVSAIQVWHLRDESGNVIGDKGTILRMTNGFTIYSRLMVSEVARRLKDYIDDMSGKGV